jgi:chromosome segregation ATPase|tara:strand:+ start:11993 stop:16114 length:4122 start_codon:yes stop_codon:yes gene_type:complete
MDDRAVFKDGTNASRRRGEDAVETMREKLEKTSIKALRALEAKDAEIARLRAELRARERREGATTAFERRRRARRGGEDEGEMSDEETFEDEDRYRNARRGRTSASASASGARVGQLERELEDERAVVIRLRRELREANGNAERLRESHEEAKKFALASEKHAGALTERMQRLVCARDERWSERENAADASERALSARVAALTVESARASEEGERWRVKAQDLEEELRSIKAATFETEILNEEEDEDAGAAESAHRLRVRLAETRLALRQALASDSAEANTMASSQTSEQIGDALSMMSQSSRMTATKSARDNAKLASAEEKISSLKRVVKELRSTNNSQANELGRLEMLLREQIASSKLTLESAEATSENATHEREYFTNTLREREEELLVLRDTLSVLESDRSPATADGDWRRDEMNRAREKIIALETENASLVNERELLAGEVRQYRHELKGESERAEAYESIAKSARQREEILFAQLEWKTEECIAYMDAELELLSRLDDAERDNLDLEISLKSCEKALRLQVERLSQYSATQIGDLKRKVQQSVTDTVSTDAAANFCRGIQIALRQTDDGETTVNQRLEEALLDAQRTIALLECTSIKYEKAFTSAMRHVEKAEHRSESTKTAFDHVCAILELSQKSYASLSSKAMSSLENRLMTTHARNVKLSQIIVRGETDTGVELNEMEEELRDRDEKIELMKARIDELEVTGSELIGARESAASAMQAMSVARDKAKKEVFEEQDRLREAQRTIAELNARVAQLHEEFRASILEDQADQLRALVEEQAQTIASASMELEKRVNAETHAQERLAEITRELEATRESFERATAELEEVRESRAKLVERTDGQSEHPDVVTKLSQRASELEKAIEVRDDRIRELEKSARFETALATKGTTATLGAKVDPHDAESLVTVALKDNRAAAVVAAAARDEVDRLKEEIRWRDDALAAVGASTTNVAMDESTRTELENIKSLLEGAFKQHEGRLSETNRLVARDTSTLQAYAEVMTARLLNLEAEIAEQKRKEEEWQASNMPGDDERRAHVERCKRYRELMQRLRQEHERERNKLLEFVKESEAKIADLTRRVQSSWAGESEAEVANLNAQLVRANQRIEELERQLKTKQLAVDATEGGFTLLTEVESADAELRDTSAKLATSVEEAARLRDELEQCKTQIESMREETKKAVEKQLTTRFRRELARHEDEIERLRERCSAFAPPCASLVEAVRKMSIRLLRMSAAVAHMSRQAQGKQSISETLMAKDANEVASLVGLSLEEITSVFAVQNIRSDGSADEAKTALSMLDSPENIAAAIAWCEARTLQLNDALTSEAPIAEVWRDDALDAVTSLVHDQASAAETCLRESTPELQRWWMGLATSD